MKGTQRGTYRIEGHITDDHRAVIVIDHKAIILTPGETDHLGRLCDILSQELNRAIVDGDTVDSMRDKE